MYICADCGRVFEDKVTYTEDWGERYTGCPSCGGYAQEATTCECGEYILANDEYPVCGSCLQKALDRLAKLLFKNFSEDELRAMNTWLEYEPINEPDKWRRVNESKSILS